MTANEFKGIKMLKKLTKVGNSRAIIIDSPILDLLQIGPDTKVYIKTDGKNLLLEPQRKFDGEVINPNKYGNFMIYPSRSKNT